MSGMTMELWIMIGLFVGAALIFTIGAIAFAAWYQRFQHDMDQPTSTHLKSVNPKKGPSRASPKDTNRL
jgi:hypothetical protein